MNENCLYYPEKDLRALDKAIWEFGNHSFFERDGFKMIGSCLVIPINFEQFVQHRYGITLQNCELRGVSKMREKYSSQERAESDVGGWGNEVHLASIYKKNVIIDWTSRQYNQQLPIPEIRDLSAEPALRARIKIY